MIRLIVGLGNPGQKYEKTRHNAGFLFLDSLADEFLCTWSQSVPFQGVTAECFVGGEKIYLLKPKTFMNLSGRSVGAVVRYFKLLPEQILVVHDELDFAPGEVKLKKNGGHAGHNGLRDIIACLGSPNFYRLRIGIGRPDTQIAVADYVLSGATQYEGELISAAIARGRGFVRSMVSGDMSKVMTDLNGNSPQQIA